MENLCREDVRKAVKDVLDPGPIGFDATKHLLLSKIEGKPARVSITLYPHLPRITVNKISPKDYITPFC